MTTHFINCFLRLTIRIPEAGRNVSPLALNDERKGDEILADERRRRLEEAHATLAELSRGLQGKGRKIVSPDDADAWLLETMGRNTHTQAEIDRRLNEFIKFGLGGDDRQLSNQTDEA